MPAIGGSIESVSVSGRPFAVASDADVSRKLGGFENTVITNGDGTSRIIAVRVAWSLTGLVLEVDDTLGDQEFLKAIQDGMAFVPVTITYANGVTYQGTGTISGESSFSNQTATANVDFSGTGDLTPQ